MCRNVRAGGLAGLLRYPVSNNGTNENNTDMNLNTLTIKAQEALQAALNLARERGQQAVEPLHLLSVLIREDDSLATFLLGRVGVNVRGLRDEVQRSVGSLPRVEGGNGEQYFSQDASRVIQRAVDFTCCWGFSPSAVRPPTCSSGPEPPRRSSSRRSAPSARGRRSIRRPPRRSSTRWASMPSTSTSRRVPESSTR